MGAKPDLPDREMPGAGDARKEIEQRHGEVLTAMQRLRDRAVKDLSESRPGEGAHIALLGIAAKAIDVFDTVIRLIEAGKSSEALANSRTLYDLELDAHLLAHLEKQKELLPRYVSFEVLEKAQLLAKLREYGTDKGDERSAEVRRWMEDAMTQSDRQVPEGFDELPLRDAAEKFARVVFGSRYPSSWKWGLKREALYEWWAESEADAGENVLTADELARRADQLRRDGELVYSIMSARLHGSPASANELLRVDGDGVQILLPAPVANLIPLTCDVAAVHFVRLQARVARSLSLDRDEQQWRDDLTVIQPT